MDGLIALSTHQPVELTVGMLLALILAITSYRLKLLDVGGCVALIVMGIIIFGIGGWTFTVPILCFFVLSSLLSKLSEFRRAEVHSLFQAQYRCSICGISTERLTHCNDLDTVLHRGLRWMDNDVVNGFCALGGAALVFMSI